MSFPNTRGIRDESWLHSENIALFDRDLSNEAGTGLTREPRKPWRSTRVLAATAGGG
jgi:hypothetical protein